MSRSVSRVFLVWALLPPALAFVAVCSAQLRGVSPLFIYPEAMVFWPAWLVSFFVLDNPEPSRGWLFAANLPYYYLLLSPTLALASSRPALRITAVLVLVVALLAQLYVSVIMGSAAFQFTYGDHNFIPR